MSGIHRPQASILDEFLHDPRTRKLYTCDPGRQYLHLAVIVKRGKILAEAYNRNGSRSSGSGYSSYSIHAEKHAVKQLGDISQLRGADLYVMRISSDKCKKGNLTFSTSTPCRDCRHFLEKCMREYGLKNVYYTS